MDHPEAVPMTRQRDERKVRDLLDAKSTRKDCRCRACEAGEPKVGERRSDLPVSLTGTFGRMLTLRVRCREGWERVLIDGSGAGLS